VTARIENERNVLQPVVLFPLPAQREAVHAWQDDVRDDGLRRLATRGIQCRQAVRRLDHPMTVTRKQCFERALFRLALECDQDDTHASSPAGRSHGFISGAGAPS
jgi:hypothetical protein